MLNIECQNKHIIVNTYPFSKQGILKDPKEGFVIQKADMVIKVFNIMKDTHCTRYFGLKKATTFPSRVTDTRGTTEKNNEIKDETIKYCRCTHLK